MSHSSEQEYLLDSVRRWFRQPEQISYYATEIDQGLTCAEQHLLFDIPKRGAVLDIGCGAGRVSLALAKRGYQLTGVDVSEELLSIAHQNALSRNLEIDFVHTEGITLPFQDAQFDIVASFKVLCYIPTRILRKAFLEELLRVLKPGGLCVLTQNIVPDEFIGEAKDQYYWRSPASQFSILEEGDTFPQGIGYVRWFTEDQLLDEIRDSDFEQVQYMSDQDYNGEGYIRLIKLQKIVGELDG